MPKAINLRKSKVQQGKSQVSTYGTQTPLSSTAVERGTTRWLNGSTVVIQGLLNVSGETNLDGTNNLSGDNNLSGPTEVTGTLTITGATTIGGSLDVTGPTNLDGVLTINGIPPSPAYWTLPALSR